MAALVANVLNRTTKQFIPSANTTEYPVEFWIIEPNMTAVVGQPSKYWIISGDVVSLMNQAQRDAVDAAELSAARDETALRVDQVEDIIRALSLTLLDELNMHTGRTNAILTAIDNGGTLAQVKTGIAAIVDLPTRTIAQLKTTLRNKLGT
jgi:hypothetical protein